MAVLVWNDPMKKFFENGIDRPVLFPHDPLTDLPDPGVAWEGLISVTEKPMGAEVTDLWANNTKYAQLISIEEFEGTIEAYAYPPELDAAMGIVVPTPGLKLPQQSRGRFSMAYRTQIHSDGGGENVGYLLHIIYNMRMQPSERPNTSVNDTPEATTFSWDFTTVPYNFPADEYRSLSKLTIDSRTAPATELAAVEELLWGSVAEDPDLPDPSELITLLTPL